MKIYSEMNLSEFEAWSGATDTLDRIISEGKCDDLEAILEDLYPEGMDETELNDLLWFEPEEVFRWLGIKTEDEILSEIDEAKDELSELEESLRELMQEQEDEPEEDYAEEIESLVNQITDLKDKIDELYEEYESI